MKKLDNKKKSFKLKLKRGDLVTVISGADKGKQGKILSVNRETFRVIVEGVCLRKRHEKPTQNNPKGGIVEKEAAIHYSNLALLDESREEK